MAEKTTYTVGAKIEADVSGADLFEKGAAKVATAGEKIVKTNTAVAASVTKAAAPMKELNAVQTAWALTQANLNEAAVKLGVTYDALGKAMLKFGGSDFGRMSRVTEMSAATEVLAIKNAKAGISFADLAAHVGLSTAQLTELHKKSEAAAKVIDSGTKSVTSNKEALRQQRMETQQNIQALQNLAYAMGLPITMISRMGSRRGGLMGSLLGGDDGGPNKTAIAIGALAGFIFVAKQVIDFFEDLAKQQVKVAQESLNLSRELEKQVGSWTAAAQAAKTYSDAVKLGEGQIGSVKSAQQKAQDVVGAAKVGPGVWTQVLEDLISGSKDITGKGANQWRPWSELLEISAKNAQSYADAVKFAAINTTHLAEASAIAKAHLKDMPLNQRMQTIKGRVSQDPTLKGIDQLQAELNQIDPKTNFEAWQRQKVLIEELQKLYDEAAGDLDKYRLKLDDTAHQIEINNAVSNTYEQTQIKINKQAENLRIELDKLNPEFEANAKAAEAFKKSLELAPLDAYLNKLIDIDEQIEINNAVANQSEQAQLRIKKQVSDLEQELYKQSKSWKEASAKAKEYEASLQLGELDKYLNKLIEVQTEIDMNNAEGKEFQQNAMRNAKAVSDVAMALGQASNAWMEAWIMSEKLKKSLETKALVGYREELKEMYNQITINNLAWDKQGQAAARIKIEVDKVRDSVMKWSNDEKLANEVAEDTREGLENVQSLEDYGDTLSAVAGDMKLLIDYWHDYNDVMMFSTDEVSRSHQHLQLLQRTIGSLGNPIRDIEQLLDDPGLAPRDKDLLRWQALQEQVQRTAKVIEQRAAANQATFGEIWSVGLQRVADNMGSWQTNMIGAINNVSTSLSNNLVNGLADILDGTKSVEDGFRDMAISIIKDLQRIALEMLVIRPLLNSLAGSFGGMSTTGIGAANATFQSGGRVGGTGTGDKVPSLLEPGEYVVKRDSARKIGYSTLEQINRMSSSGTTTRYGGVARMNGGGTAGERGIFWEGNWWNMPDLPDLTGAGLRETTYGPGSPDATRADMREHIGIANLHLQQGDAALPRAVALAYGLRPGDQFTYRGVVYRYADQPARRVGKVIDIYYKGKGRGPSGGRSSRSLRGAGTGPKGVGSAMVPRLGPLYQYEHGEFEPRSYREMGAGPGVFPPTILGPDIPTSYTYDPLTGAGDTERVFASMGPEYPTYVTPDGTVYVQSTDPTRPGFLPVSSNVTTGTAIPQLPSGTTRVGGGGGTVPAGMTLSPRDRFRMGQDVDPRSGTGSPGDYNPFGSRGGPGSFGVVSPSSPAGGGSFFGGRVGSFRTAIGFGGSFGGGSYARPSALGGGHWMKTVGAVYRGLAGHAPYKYPAPALTKAIMGNAGFMRSQGFGPTLMSGGNFAGTNMSVGSYWANQFATRGYIFHPPQGSADTGGGVMRQVPSGSGGGRPRTFHEGGIVDGWSAYASGGVVKQGEGVFTPDQMRSLAPSGGMNVANTQINVTVNNAASGGSSSESSGDVGTERGAKELSRAVEAAVQAHIAKQRRSGGLLYVSRAERGG